MTAQTRNITEKVGAARASVISAVFLTAIKTVVGFATGSLGILAEALHSLLDLGAALMTWFAVHYAERPADDRHHYGHGKLENLSAVAETLLLVATCGWIAKEAIERLVTPKAVEASVWGIVVMGTSIAVDWHRSRRLHRAAKKYKSQALEADALHFSSDILSSAVVIFGLIMIRIGYKWADPVAALFVAGWVLIISVRLGVRAVQALLDAAPHGASDAIVQAIEKLDGVERVTSVRVREAGAGTFADVKLIMDGKLSLHEVHEELDRAEEEVRSILPGADITVHAEPAVHDDEDERMQRNVMRVTAEIAAEHQFRHFHARITSDSRSNKVALVCIGFPPQLPLLQARASADLIEKQLMQRVEGLHDAVVHIEASTEEVSPTEMQPGSQIAEEELRVTILAVPGVTDCHEMLLSPYAKKGAPAGPSTNWTLSVHVSLRASVTVAESHDLADAVEQAIEARFPQIIRVHVHQEPDRPKTESA